MRVRPKFELICLCSPPGGICTAVSVIEFGDTDFVGDGSRFELVGDNLAGCSVASFEYRGAVFVRVFLFKQAGREEAAGAWPDDGDSDHVWLMWLIKQR